ncbi:DNA repair protein Rad4 [Cryptosporidium felis]|nr:DNA repair protein Rad4 [Cryptosporidium felis]
MNKISNKTSESIGWWIISVNENDYLKETTGRYVSDWNLVMKTQLKNSNRQMITNLIERLNAMFNTYGSKILQIEMIDEFELEKLISENDVIPTSKSSFKNHPKYAIISSLNSLEIIHPKEPIVGYFEGEPIYLRENVHVLKTKKQWEREQREVKLNQLPIKTINKAKTCNDNGLNCQRKLEYFAEFQTQIKPITDLNYLDKIPVDKFKSINTTIKGSVPDSCIHIQDLPEESENCETWKIENIADVVKRSGIDYARALVGYDYKNKSKPIYNGVVIKKNDFNLFHLYKKRNELENINKIAIFIWNDIFQNLKNMLNSCFIDSSPCSFSNRDSTSPEFKEDDLTVNARYVRTIKNLPEKLMLESYEIVDKKKKAA